MNAQVRDVLRSAGMEAGRRARRDAGLPEYVEDPNVIQRMAELMQRANCKKLIRKAGGDRR
jgi:hypothetical protein